MSTPVVADQWAGDLECSGPCRRKRLMAEEFSKTALTKYRKQGGPLRCKQCVAAAEQLEREQAAARKAVDIIETTDPLAGSSGSAESSRVCAACQIDKPVADFNKNQWNKGAGVGRCRACVEQSVADEKASNERAQAEKLAAAQAEVEKAKKSGNATAILKAESVLSALQAEKVTGLKPVRMNRGGGGRGRGRGGRGRGGGRR